MNVRQLSGRPIRVSDAVLKRYTLARPVPNRQTEEDGYTFLTAI